MTARSLAALAILAVSMTAFVQVAPLAPDSVSDPDVVGLAAAEARDVLGAPVEARPLRNAEEWVYELDSATTLKLMVRDSAVEAQTLVSTYRAEEDAVHRLATVTAGLALDGIAMDKRDLRGAYLARGRDGRRHATTMLSSRLDDDGEREFVVLASLMDFSGRDAD